jgi:hypothetical protein
MRRLALGSRHLTDRRYARAENNRLDSLITRSFGTGLRHDVLRERSRTSLLVSFTSLAGRLLRRRLILRQQLQQLLALRFVCCSGEEPQIVLELLSVDEPVHGRCTAYVNARESFNQDRASRCIDFSGMIAKTSVSG